MLLGQNFPLFLGQNSKFTPFYRVKIHPFLLGQNSKFTLFYWVKTQNLPLFIGTYFVNVARFARKLF